MKFKYLFMIIVILINSCNNKNELIDGENVFHGVDLNDYRGQRLFYFLDKMNRLNYKSIRMGKCYYASPISFGSVYLDYSDGLRIEIVYDSLEFMPNISRCDSIFEADESWTADNFLKERIDDIYIIGKINKKFIMKSTTNSKLRKGTQVKKNRVKLISSNYYYFQNHEKRIKL